MIYFTLLCLAILAIALMDFFFEVMDGKIYLAFKMFIGFLAIVFLGGDKWSS